MAISQLLLFLWKLFCLGLVGTAAKSCLTFCCEGKFCSDLSCYHCPDGTFRSDCHSETYCKKWSLKPPGQNWVLKEIGTSMKDQLWDCKEGYTQRQHTPLFNETVCMLDSIAVESTTSSNNSAVNATISFFTDAANEHSIRSSDREDGLSNGAIVGIVIGIIVPLVIVPIVIVIKNQEVDSPRKLMSAYEYRQLVALNSFTL